jgi:nucleoside diphosphate kinase
MADATERTFIMIKPDGVQRGVVGDVIHRFEQRGYKLVGLKFLQVSLRKFISKKKRYHNSIKGTKSFA